MRHVAWEGPDVALARGLATRRDAPAVRAGYFRLAIDGRLHHDAPTALPFTSVRHRIPGNQGLDSAGRPGRASTDQTADPREIPARRAAFHVHRDVPVLVGGHRCRPVFGGRGRPSHSGLAGDHQRCVVPPSIDRLRGAHRLLIGDNEPACGSRRGDDTISHRSERLARAINAVWQDPAIDARRRGPSSPAAGS